MKSYIKQIRILLLVAAGFAIILVSPVIAGIIMMTLGLWFASFVAYPLVNAIVLVGILSVGAVIFCLSRKNGRKN